MTFPHFFFFFFLLATYSYNISQLLCTLRYFCKYLICDLLTLTFMKLLLISPLQQQSSKSLTQKFLLQSYLATQSFYFSARCIFAIPCTYSSYRAIAICYVIC